LARVMLTYLTFLLGLLAMQTAQAAARGLENAVQLLLDRAKAAREAYEQKRLEAKNRPAIGSDEETDAESALLASSEEAKTETRALERAGAAGLPAAEETPAALGV